MLTDLPEAALWEYRSSAEEPADFDEFWARTLAEASVHDLAVLLEPVDTHLVTVDVFDLTFAGYGGDPIKGWLYLPRGGDGPLPGVVQYIGYGGGRGHWLESLAWSSAGFAHLIMDSRGQGSTHRPGATGDPSGTSGPTIPGVMTRGIEHPDGHYYRRLFTDCVRAVDVLASLPEVDSTRIGVVGGSQGGAMALAVGALRTDVAAVAAHVPFLCDIRRATQVTNNEPYYEITRYLANHRNSADMVFGTLSYFDGVNLAKRNTTPTWVSAALMDPTCPPSTVFGAFHNLAGEKSMRVWQFNGHEGGGPFDEERAGRAFVSRLRSGAPVSSLEGSSA